MSENTIIHQGYFTSAGIDTYIPLRSSVDWVKVYNLTNIAGGAQWAGLTWWWQNGLTQGDAVTEYHAAATQAVSMSTCAVGYNFATYRGIYLFDTSDQTPSAARAVTAGTNATRPVYSAANTTGLADHAIVRIANTDHTNLNGLDFSIDTVVASTSFRLANTLATAPGLVGGANGTYRLVAPTLAAYKLMYPDNRVIANITQAVNPTVTTLVDHGYSVGSKVRINLKDSANGMLEINEMVATVLTTPTAATFTIDIDTTGFTAFTFQLPADTPLTPANCVPVGTRLIYGATELGDSARNQATLGILLGTSATAGVALGSAGGTNGDVIKWIAGKTY
jgi:hypothetical protein